MKFETLRERFEKYTDTFRDKEGLLPESMQLKYAHTLEVLSIAERIAEKEHFSEQAFFLARAGALFHDTARYMEIRKFHTFDDRKAGIDHGHEGVRILCELELLAGLPPMEQMIVLSAVELHNKASVDYMELGPLFAQCTKIVRDSDKLSILGILLRLATGKLQVKDEDIVKLGRPDAQTVSPEVVDAVLNGKTVYHKDMHSLLDFLIALFGWSADFQFAATAEYALEKQIYPQLREVLPQEPVMDKILHKTLDRLQCLSSK